MTRRDTRSWSASGAVRGPMHRRCSSTATTTCSPPSRSSSGRHRPSSRKCATAACTRGSVDDKGQLFLHIKALEAHLKTRSVLPCNVVVIAEGEEEVGSENLEAFIERERDLLAADAVVISDSSMFAEGIPSILSSLRGLAYFQIDVQGPSGDLHSG